MNVKSIAFAPPSPLLSPINCFTSQTRPLLPIDVANILPDLRRENSRFQVQPKAFSGSLLSQPDDITGTGAVEPNNLDTTMTDDYYLGDSMGELPDDPYAGLFNSGETLRSVGVERIRKGQTSKASVMLEALQKLKLKKVTATDRLLEEKNRSC
jgi:hypothetical protein